MFIFFAVCIFVSTSFAQGDKPPTDEKEFVRNLRMVYRKDIVGCPEMGECTKEATDDDLQKWLSKFSRPDGTLSAYNIERIRSKLGNGFGAMEKYVAGNLWLLPPGRGSLDQVYIVAQPGEDMDLSLVNKILAQHDKDPISDFISLRKYETLLRRRMDRDASGKVDENEFVNYLIKNRNYAPAKSN